MALALSKTRKWTLTGVAVIAQVFVCLALFNSIDLLAISLACTFACFIPIGERMKRQVQAYAKVDAQKRNPCKKVTTFEHTYDEAGKRTGTSKKVQFIFTDDM